MNTVPVNSWSTRSLYIKMVQHTKIDTPFVYPPCISSALPVLSTMSVNVASIRFPCVFDMPAVVQSWAH